MNILLNSEQANIPLCIGLILCRFPSLSSFLLQLGGLEQAASAAGLTTLNPSVRLNCLPLWCVLRSLGEDQLRQRIENIFQMLEVLNNKLGEYQCLRVLSQR